jgi:amino acid transporter
LIGSVFGVCFAVLAARAIGVLSITPGHFQFVAVVVALACACLAYTCFRCATSGRTDHASFQRAMVGGVLGAFAGLVILLLAYLFYRNGARAQFAHAIGLHFQQVTLGLLLAALALLGFGAGFSLRLPRPSKNPRSLP